MPTLINKNIIKFKYIFIETISYQSESCDVCMLIIIEQCVTQSIICIGKVNLLII